MGKNMIKIASMTMLVLLLLTNYAAAMGMMPRADEVFVSTKVSLSSKIGATYVAQTKMLCSEIKITDCVLQVKEGSEWVDDTSLTPPSKIATNTNVYKATGSYSESCSSGNTYRLKVIFNADGHPLTAYSNSINY